MLVTILTLLVFDGPVSLKTAVTLEPLPEDGEYFFQAPSSFDIDRDGNYYVLDAEAGTIFTWSKTGNYLKTIGKPGEGPGEFQFSGRGPAYGFVSAADDQLVVYDPRKTSLQLFDFNGNFQKAIPLGGGRGRMMYFTETSGDQFLSFKRTRLDEGFFALIQIIDPEGKVVKELERRKDDSFSVSGNRNSGRRRFSIKPYNPQLGMGYDRKSGELAIGFSGEPSFDVIDKDGKKRRIKVPLAQRDVNQEAKDEYLKRFESMPRTPEFEWPDKMAYYTHLVILGDKGFLVYSQSPHYGNLSGVRLDKQGKTLGRFEQKCGVGGSLMVSAGRVLLVSTNEDDEFELREVNID